MEVAFRQLGGDRGRLFNNNDEAFRDCFRSCLLCFSLLCFGLDFSSRVGGLMAVSWSRFGSRRGGSVL